MAAITLDIGGNTRRLDRDIQKTVNRVYAINLKTKGDQPLGRITGQVNEFNKSLDASNARVIAFGASAGIIFGVQRAFNALVGATIEVQKSLQDINVILNVSTENLQKFGGELFSIAKNTGQSFQEVAKAATEFSRQGLGVEETLKRTNEALILSRLSGLDAAKSVEALTAAVNSYASQAITASEVVNKFANVDSAFAVSSADLAEALERVGSSAAQSGVSLNELIAIVTSAQQTTARGGAVIGNSFKTIFTRLQRGRVVDLLGTLGISDTDTNGQLKSTIQLLQDLGKVYDTLGARQQAAVAEQVGGVFQINILKAALADLGKEYSIYSSALNVAAGTTDQAIRRNEELNKTYAAQLNALQENARQIASAAGERLLGPSIDRLVGGSNTLLGGINESDGQGVGAVLGKGILDGLGQFISGPGIALIGGVLLKLFSDLGKFATGSVQQLLGLNTAATQQRDLQASITSILTKNPDLLNLALKGEEGINTAANTLLASLRNQTLELQNQEKVAQRIAKAFAAQAGVRVSGGVPIVPTGRAGKADGYIPNFSAEVFDARGFGATKNVRETKNIGTIGGKAFQPNTEEIQIPNMFGSGDTGVIPTYGNGIKEATKMIARGESGSVLDKSDRNKSAGGFIPNFANTVEVDRLASVNPRIAKSIKGNLEGDDTITSKNIQSLFFENVGNQSGKKYEVEALKYLNSVSGGGFVDSKNLKYGKTSAIDAYRVRDDKIDLAEFKGGRFLNQLVLNKMLRGVPENYGKGNPLDIAFNESNPAKGVTDDVIIDGYLIQSSKKNQKEVGSKFSEKNVIKAKAAERSSKKKYYEKRLRGAASGFIPNFAKQKQASKNAIDLGNLDTIPNKLGNKVVSLIYPGLSDGYSLRTATANYLKQDYRGNIPVAGINQKTLKSQLPDLDENLGNLLVREANQFGQSLGGTNFLKSAKELPNFGAAKGAVGVAFEAGVQTLLQQKIGRKQNAGIDFRNITPRLRSIFNGAPGMYDAKSSPDLTNEVFKKLLNETRPGALVQKSSGQAGKDYAAKRSAAVNQLRQEARDKNMPEPTGVKMRQLLREQFGIVGKAAGYIPNFAAIQAPLQNAINSEIAAGASSNQIRVDKNSKLKTSFNPDGLGVWSKKYEGSLPEGIRMAEKSGINPKTKGMPKAGGYIPNFAIEDPDVEGASAGTGIAAISAQLTGLAFAFAFTGNEFKNKLKELSLATKATAETQRKSLADKIRADRAEARRTSSLGPNARQITRADGTLGRYTGDTRQQSVMAVGGRFESERERARRQSQPGMIQRGLAFGGTNAFGLAMAAPILGETLKNVIGQETTGNRQAGAVAGGLGQIGSFAATGALIAPGPIGAGVGAAIGALLTIPTVVNEFTSDLPELSAAARKSSQELTKFSDVSSRILTGFSKVTELSSGTGSPKALSKAQEELSKTLSELSLEEKNKVSNALKLGTLEEELAKIIEERIKTEKQALQKVALQTAADSTFLGLKGLGTFETSSEKGKEQAKSIEEIFRQSFTSGRTDKESLEVITKASSEGTPVLQNLLKGLTRAQALGGRQGLGIQQASLPAFEKALQSFLPESETKADNIKGLVNIANNNIESFINLLSLLIDSIGKAPEEIQKNIDLFNETTKAANDLAKAQKEYTQNTDNLVSSLSRSISVLNNFINTLDRFENLENSFGRERAIGQAFTTPRNISETVLGPDADLTQQFSLFEQIAKNENQRLTAIENSNQQFKESFRTNLDTALGERLVEIQNLKGSGSGNVKELQEAEKQIKEASELLRNGAVDINNVLKDSFTGGTIDPEKLESDLRSAFERSGISGGESQKILDGIYQSAIVQQNASLETNVLAKQQNIKAATEVTNKKILRSLDQSLKVFGGVNKFLSPPEEGIVKPLETLIKSASLQLQSQRGFEFAKRTGAGTSFGTDSQVQNNIGLGQSSLNFIKELQDLSGGAFTPDPGSELYRRAAAGLTQSFENNIKQLNDVLKDPEVDSSFKSQIKATLDAIGVLGSGREVAQLQIAQETGSAFQSTLEGTLSRLQDPAIEQLREAGLNELADEVARSSKYTSDPIVNVLGVQRSIQAGIAEQLEKITKILNKPKGGPTPSQTISPPIEEDVQTNAKGLIPAFNNERKAISRGVGGAKTSDRPQFIPNLNGGPAFVNSGEQLVDNYMGSRQTAVLTRDMQKGMSKGFIPNFAPQQIIDPTEFSQAESFKTIKGKVVQDLTDTGKDYIVIRSETPLNESFVDKKIPFGKGKQTGKIISIDPYDRFSARVGSLEGDFLPPVKDNTFISKLESKQKENLTEKEIQEKIDEYSKSLKNADKFFISRNNTGTPADAADILKGLQEKFEFNSRNYSNLDNNSEYKTIKDTVEILRNKIRSTNSRVQERPQDPEFLRFLEDQKSKPRGVGPATAIQDQITEAVAGSATGDAVAKATAVNPEDLYTDALIRAAGVTAKLGKYTGLNLGTNDALGKANERPKVKIKPQKGGGADAGPFVYGLSEFVEFYSRNPGIDAFFNEATHVNQNLVPGKDVLGELSSSQKAIEESGGPQAYLQNLKKFANFIEQQNQNAKTPFVDIRRVATQAGYDQRRFGNIISEEDFSEMNNSTQTTRYIQERSSTLNDALSRGIVSGEINAKELGLLGMPLDVATSIVAETIAIDKQLKEQKPYQPSRPVTPPPSVPGIPTAGVAVPPPNVEDLPTKPTPTPKPITPPRAIPGIPTAVPEQKPAIPKAATGYPGGISDATARAIVQELDSTYNEAIRNSKSPGQAKSWAQTQQRYRLFYSRGQYAELDRFYKSLQKGSNYNSDYGQGTGRRGETVQRFAAGFIPNFAQNYISNLAGLEAGLSGEDPAMGYDKKIGRFMYNKGQSKSGNLNEIISKDHPEGLKNAIKNSMKMQKSMGVMNKGYIPNFAATDQSFAQQEAAFNSNTSALTTLAGGIESLNSTISNFQSNFANLNNTSPAQAAAGLQQPNAQPNVQTTTNAPVNVVVNAQGSSDIAAAVGEAVQNAIPTIIDKVKVALGQKVPPKSSQS